MLKTLVSQIPSELCLVTLPSLQHRLSMGALAPVMAESGFTSRSQIAPPDLDLASGYYSMVAPHCNDLNSDHRRSEEEPWPQAGSDAWHLLI